MTYVTSPIILIKSLSAKKLYYKPKIQGRETAYHRITADLFNGTLFGGERVLDPDTLTESDTDISSVLKFNGHAETLGHLLDVV